MQISLKLFQILYGLHFIVDETFVNFSTLLQKLDFFLAYSFFRLHSFCQPFRSFHSLTPFGIFAFIKEVEGNSMGNRKRDEGKTYKGSG